jgi:preprotein translocase subunit SecE
MKKIINFFKESYAELKKVNWPTRDDVTAQTIVVIVSLFFVSIALYLIDFAAFTLLEKIITLGK